MGVCVKQGDTFKAPSRSVAGTLQLRWALSFTTSLTVVITAMVLRPWGLENLPTFMECLLHAGPGTTEIWSLARRTLSYSSPFPAESFWEVSYKLNLVFPPRSPASAL